jgi:hypothetical protein
MKIRDFRYRKKKSRKEAIFLGAKKNLHSKKHMSVRGIAKNPIMRAIRIYFTILSFRVAAI